MESDYLIYGAPISLFTRKLEAAMRFYAAPFRTERKDGDNSAEIESRSSS